MLFGFAKNYPYLTEIEPVNFAAEYRATPEWRAMNPVGKVPVMTDGDMTMFESCAMMQYVLDRCYGRLQPKDDATYAHYLQWCWFAESTFARPLGEIVNHVEFKPELDDVVAEMKSGQLRAWVRLMQPWRIGVSWEIP